MSQEPPRVEVSATELRALYTASAYPSRIAANELQRYIMYERLLPGGGFSRIIAYTERGRTAKLLVLHQRTHVDGSVTEPDPKLMVHSGITYWTR